MENSNLVSGSNSDLEEDVAYSVRDFVKVQTALAGSSQRSGTPKPERSYKKYKIDVLLLYYIVAANMIMILAEAIVEDSMDNFEVGLIVAFQADHPYHGTLRMFFDLFGFPPLLWAFIPGVILTFVPNASFRITSYRMLLLNALGRFLKWNLNMVFQQGRPFWISSKVKMWHCPQVYGFPSGHATLLLLTIWPICETFWNRAKPLQNIRSRRSFGSALYVPRYRYEGAGDTNDISYHQAVHRHRRSQARMITFFLVGVYAICMLSRVFLGTHFIHDLLFGITLAVLLIIIITDYNVRVWLDRISSYASELSHAGDNSRNGWTYAAHSLLKALALSIFLIAIIEINLGFVNSFSDEDPPKWEKRSQSICKQELLTRDNLPYAYGSVGSLIGTVTALTFLAWPDGVYLFPSDKLLELRQPTIAVLICVHAAVASAIIFLIPRLARPKLPTVNSNNSGNPFYLDRQESIISFFCHFVAAIWIDFVFIRVCEYFVSNVSGSTKKSSHRIRKLGETKPLIQKTTN